MLSHPTPTQPWQFVSQDIFELDHKQYLITVDHYSDFYELDPLTNSQSSTIINLTKAHFARYGIPLRCLTDNGPQFVSHEYKAFSKTYGFEHVTLSPYCSRSNGKAEAAVKDVKSTLKKSHDIHLALLNIRNTPPRGLYPAQRLMGRRTRSTLPISAELLKPEPPEPLTVCSEITRRKEASKAQYDKHAKPDLLPLPLGSHVYAKPRPSQWGTPWIYGQVVDNPSPRSYSVDKGNLVLRRNRIQLRQAAHPQHSQQQPPALPTPRSSPFGAPTISSDLSLRKFDQPPATSHQADCQPSLPPTAPQQPVLETSAVLPDTVGPTSTIKQTTRSGRQIKIPKKFEDYSLY